MNETGQLADDAGIVRVLKALAHPKRLRMVQEIAAAGELSCGAVCGSCEVPQPTGSHHLKILCDAGIVVTRREAQHVYLSINRALLDALTHFLPTRIFGRVPKRQRA